MMAKTMRTRVSDFMNVIGVCQIYAHDVLFLQKYLIAGAVKLYGAFRSRMNGILFECDTHHLMNKYIFAIKFQLFMAFSCA